MPFVDLFHFNFCFAHYLFTVCLSQRFIDEFIKQLGSLIWWSWSWYAPQLLHFFSFIFETFRSQRKLLQLRPAGSSQSRLPCANSAAARRFQVEEAFGCDERNCDLTNYFFRSASGGNCFNCGQPGHRKIDCPSLASGESAGSSSGFRSSGSSGACFNCGQTGHRKADCPSAVAGGSRPPIVCFK